MLHVEKQIAIIRKTGLGDVIYCEPLARAIHQQHGNCQIFFYTKWPEVFENHPFVEIPNKWLTGIRTTYNANSSYETIWWNLYDLSLSNRKNPEFRTYEFKPIPYGIMAHLGFDSLEDMLPKLYLTKNEIMWAKEMLGHGQWIFMDPGYPNRHAFDVEETNMLIDKLQERGFKVFIIGAKDHSTTEKDYYANNRNYKANLDLRGRTSVRQMFSLMEAADFYIGIESAPTAVAQALNKRGVLLSHTFHPSSLLISGCKLTSVACYDKLDVEGVLDAINTA